MKFFAWLVGKMPRIWILWLGRRLGWLAFSVLRIRRDVTLDNIQQALDLPQQERLLLGRQVYDHLCIGALEFLRLGRLTPDRAREIMGQPALARLEELQSRGRGVLVLTAHLGNWDLLACCAALCGLRLSVVTRRIKASWLNNFWMEQRRACGVRLLPEGGGATSILRALRNNEMVALVLDQHAPGEPVQPFFGRPAATGTALARLAQRTGSPVVPAFLFRSDEGFELALQEPLSLQQTDDPESDIAENTKLFLNVIEAQIRKKPHQWLWLHRRWKVSGKKNGDRDQ